MRSHAVSRDMFTNKITSSIEQVGAAIRALSVELNDTSTQPVATVQCASLKANMGHLEAAAAAAGLASLIVGPLLAATVSVNAQLRGSDRETRHRMPFVSRSKTFRTCF